MKKCPLCAGKGSDLAFPYETNWNGNEFQYIGCDECGTAFLVPQPSETDFEKMYAKENYYDAHYNNIELGHYKVSIANMMKYCDGRRSILDFGCGNGGFLTVAQQNDFLCCGVEYNDKVIEKAHQNSGVPVHNFEYIKKSGQEFDIIHLGDVLEHIPAPRAMIEELRELLSPDGLFFIEGPLENNPSLVYFSAVSIKAARRNLKIDSPGTFTPNHLFLTNKKAILYFFSEVLKFRCLNFEIYETGWPYLSTDKVPSSIGYLIKSVIGLSAVILSKIDIFRNKTLGNRFIGIFQL